MLFQWLNEYKWTECFMLIWGFLHSALPGFYRGKQDSLLF